MPVSWPPCTTLTSPSGSPARPSTRTIRSPASAARAAGLKTTPLPASSAPAIWPSGCANGALPAPITADDAVGLVRDPRALGERERAVDAHAARAQGRRAVVGDPLERVDRGQQLERRDLGARAALLGDQHVGELVEVVDHRLRHAAHVARAVGDAQQRPQRLHLRDRSDDVLDALGRVAATVPSSAPVAGLRAVSAGLGLLARARHRRRLSLLARARGESAPAARRARPRPRRARRSARRRRPRARAPAARRVPAAGGGSRSRRGPGRASARCAAMPGTGCAPCSRTWAWAAAERASRRVGLRRQGEVDRGLRERVARLGQADVLDRCGGRGRDARARPGRRCRCPRRRGSPCAAR